MRLNAVISVLDCSLALHCHWPRTRNTNNRITDRVAESLQLIKAGLIILGKGNLTSKVTPILAGVHIWARHFPLTNYQT
ncbi:hypothetical protein F4813DRAFT_142162 [Daldinia decipiens]|uniref:uncharacterized protein n=1 Tax=Daldinia decipiens TaxID=326647 RepID=UPI0020C39B4C|nr:uncharacterized protein F4813DRAFT_142162 [Daldinia decipiens]KAI1656010.1 hypothetical protein F4813DRAFT_142162 [Daldinia decipiens]